MTDAQDPPRDPALSRLYRQGTGGEPAPALDAAILAAARAAVVPRPAPVRPWWTRLTVPVGVAATALFAVMLSLTVQRQTPQTTASPEASSPPALPARPAAEAAGQPAAAAKASESAAAAPAPRADTALSAPRRDGAERKAMSPPAPVPVPVPAPLAVPAPTPAASGAADAAAGSLQKAERAAGAPLPPAQWLDEIRALRRQGRHDEAAQRLAEFRRAYPDFALPDDLKP